MFEVLRKVRANVCAISKSPDKAIDDYAIPAFDTSACYNLPQCQIACLSALPEDHKELF